MPKAPHRGRHSIFRGKDGGIRVQGIITRAGGHRFEVAARRLERLYRDVVGAKPATISDADVIEYLARGDDDTRAYLEAQKG
jgi:hypothetical protein